MYNYASHKSDLKNELKNDFYNNHFGIILMSR